MTLTWFGFRRTIDRPSSPARRRQGNRHGRPNLEWLETRLAPAVSTWSGAVDGLWSNDANWDVPPANGNDLSFPAGVSNTSLTNDLAGGEVFQSITFSGVDYTIAGNTLSLDGPISATQVSGNNTLTLPIAFSGAGSVSVDNSGASLAIDGLVTGTAGLAKLGAGTLTLSADNTYTGTTAVDAGTLLVNGNQASTAVTVDATATFGGLGTVGSIVSTGGTVRPGNDGVGVLTTGGASLGASSSFAVTLNSTTPGAGYGQLVTSGPVTLDGAQLNVTLGFSPTANETFVIVDNTGSDPIDGIFTGLPEASVVTLPGGAFRISYVGGTGNDIVLTHLQATTTTLDATPNPSVFGQSVTFTATVAPVSGGVTPTGSVSFFNGTTLIGTVPLTGDTASIDTSALPVGASSITAQYLGDSEFAPSTSPNVLQQVGLATTTTVLTTAPNPSVFGQTVTLTATVAPVSPGAGTPGGTVNFFNGSTLVGTATLSGGVATVDVSSLAVGTANLTAEYAGDASFAASDATAVSQQVDQAATTTVLTTSPNPSVYGQSVRLTATVGASSPGSGTPAGSVQFSNGSTVLGTATLTDGVAIFDTSALPLGTLDLTATYLGNTSFSTSTSAAVSQQVDQATTTTVLTATPNPSVFGQTVTLTATVSRVVAGAIVPSGTVQFFNGSSLLGTGTLAGGIATFTTSSLPLGSSSLTAVYQGTAEFATSTSAAVTQQVNQAASSTVVLSAPNPSVFGQSITLTATVSAASPGVGEPTGTVEFFNGSTSLGTATLASGQGSITVSGLPAGTASFTARYSGNTNFLAGTSPAITHQVNLASTTITVSASTDTPSAFAPVTLTATIGVTSPGAGTPGGTVLFYGNDVLLGTADVVNGVATFTASGFAAGTTVVSAVYSGDASFATSSSSDVTLVVGTANELYVEQLYQVLLLRSADPSGLAFWSGLLDQGVSRKVVVQKIATSPTARAIVVQQAFQTYLGRTASPHEVSLVVKEASNRGVSIDSVILGTREYYYNIGGGTYYGYLDALAHDTLGTRFSPGAEATLIRMASEGQPLSQIANEVFVSPAGTTMLVRTTYYELFGTEPTNQELDQALYLLKRGVRMRQLTRAWLASAQYYAFVTGTA